MIGATKAAGAVVLALGLIGSSVANATPTYTPTFTSNAGAGTETFTADTGAQITDFLTQFNIPKFTSSLGTLTSLSISLGGSMNAVGSLTNSAQSAATGVTIFQNSTITDNPVQPVANSFGAVTITTGSANGDTFLVFTTSATNGTGYASVAPGTSINNIPLAASFATQTLTESSSFDPNLIGNGTFGILLATGEYTLAGEGSGNLAHTVTTQDDLNLSVTYNYINATPSVPEPASLTVLGTGLMGIAATARRRRKN